MFASMRTVTLEILRKKSLEELQLLKAVAVLVLWH